MKDSQKYLQHHSEAKIKLLQVYLEAYLGVISHDGYTRKIQVADLFCGIGMFPGNKTGSPLTIGRVMGDLVKNTPNAPEIVFHYNDSDSEKVATVASHLDPIAKAHPDKLTFIGTSLPYSELLPRILADQKADSDKKWFLFIDPYGYKDVKIDDVFKLLENNNTEILLFQPTSFLFRFSENGTPKTLTEFMQSLSSGKPWPEGLDIWGYIQHTKNLLREKLRNQYYVDSFTIQKDAKTVFCMFFFTPHIRGFEKMLEAKWKLNKETGLGWHYSAVDGHQDMFTEPQPQTKILESELWKLLDESSETKNADIYFRTVEQGFLPKHARDILSSWQATGKITVLPLSTRKKAFYLNYKDHQKDSRIITISKQQS